MSPRQRAGRRKSSILGTILTFIGKPVTRAVVAIVLLVVIGGFVIVALGRPKTVSFEASFKCDRFSPGIPIALEFSECDQVRFTTGMFRIPRSAYDVKMDDERARDVEQEEPVLEVGLGGPAPVVATLQGGYERTARIDLGSDLVVELRPPKESEKLGEFLVASEKISLSLSAWDLTFTTESDGDFEGFNDGIGDELLGTISINEYEESQGGVPPMVSADVPVAIGAVSIRGKIDETAGWQPVLLSDKNSNEPLQLENARLLAENVSSYALSVAHEKIDVGPTVDRLEIDVATAKIKKFALQRDAVGGSITVAISGDAQSIVQNNKEMIEPVLSRLLSRPSYSVGIAGSLMIFVIFAAGVLLKRALDVLAERCLPKS